MFCHHCGTQVADDVKFCTACGKPLAGQPAPAAPSAAWVPPTQAHAAAGRWLGAAWHLVMSDLGSYLLLTLLFFLLSVVPFISGSLIAGFHVYTMKKLTGRNADVGDLFKGFSFFLDAFVATLLIGVFTFLGTLALIIPGLIVAAMYKFTYLFMVDKRMDFWRAMKASHAVVRNDYFGFTMFLILAFLVNVVGLCCLVIGLFVTVPMTFAAVTIAYQELVGFDQRNLETL